MIEAGEATAKDATLARVAELEAVTGERDRLRDAYRALQLELELIRRRMFVAKAEQCEIPKGPVREL